MTKPYSLELVDTVDSYVSAFKIGSRDIAWVEIIDYIAEKGKPLFSATGETTMEKLELVLFTCSRKIKILFNVV